MQKKKKKEIYIYIYRMEVYTTCKSKYIKLINNIFLKDIVDSRLNCSKNQFCCLMLDYL